jgi:hypothetical protein
MPKYRFELQSQRGKPIEDPVLVYILETEKSGLVRNGRNLKPDDKSFTVDVMPGKYQLSLEVSDFENFFTNELVLPKTDADPQTITVQLEHTCKVLPSYGELDGEQRRLFETYRPNGESAWDSLDDNRCATFFQVSYALSQTRFEGAPISSFVSRVKELGGARIEDDIPDGTVREATGWRMHVVLDEAVRDDIERILTSEELAFEQDKKEAVDTHAKFGLIHSFRQGGGSPHLQVVLNEGVAGTERMADVDLDVGAFHRSAPSVVFGDFSARWPEVAERYSF